MSSASFSFPADGQAHYFAVPFEAISATVNNASQAIGLLYRNDGASPLLGQFEAGSQRVFNFQPGRSFIAQTAIAAAGTLDITLSDRMQAPSGIAGPSAVQQQRVIASYNSQPPDFLRGQARYISILILNQSGGAADLEVSAVYDGLTVPLSLASAVPNGEFTSASFGQGSLFESTTGTTQIHIPDVIRVTSTVYPIFVDLFATA